MSLDLFPGQPSMCGLVSWFVETIKEGNFFKDLFGVIFVVKVFNNIFNFLAGDFAVGFLFENGVDFSCAFVRILIFNVHFEKAIDC